MFQLGHTVLNGGIDGAYSLNSPIRMAKIPSMRARTSILLKKCAYSDMLRFGICNKKFLAMGHGEITPLSKDTIDSVLQVREVGQHKELSVLLVRDKGWF
jgi:hypothetical protein